MKKIIKYLFLFLFNFNITLFCSNSEFKMCCGLTGLFAICYGYNNIKQIHYKIKKHRKNNLEDSKISSTHKVMSENKFNLFKSTIAIGFGLLAFYHVLSVKLEYV